MGSGDAADVALTLRQLRLDRLQDEAEEARQIAERRSGERGLSARQALVAAEAALAEAEAALAAPVSAEEEHAALDAGQVRSLHSMPAQPAAPSHSSVPSACCSRSSPLPPSLFHRTS